MISVVMLKNNSSRLAPANETSSIPSYFAIIGGLF